MRPRTRPLLWIPLAFAALAIAATGAAAGLYPLTDAELAGPVQPIDFSHKVHAGDLVIQCLYCHTGADKSQHAVIPAVSVCTGCHVWVKAGQSAGSEAQIAKIFEYVDRGEPIPWVRIHGLPEYVQFKHNRHVGAEIACQDCHGKVEEMHRVYLTPDTRYSTASWLLPAAKLEMGWCMDCHDQKNGSQDCFACHY